MDVKVKKRDCQSPAGGIFVMLLFMAFGTGVLMKFQHEIGGDYSSQRLMAVFSDLGIPVLFSLFFWVMAIYFFSLLCKGPRGYKALMTVKRQEEYEGENVTYMEFEVEKPEKKVSNLPTTYKCYTGEYVPFQPGSHYVIGIKEFNWKIMWVGAWNGENAIEQMGTVTMKPVFGGILLVFGGGILFLLFHLFSQIRKQENYTSNLFPILLLVLLSIYTYRLAKTWKMDNTIVEKPATGRGPDKGTETLPANMTTPDFFSIELVGHKIHNRLQFDILDGNRQLLWKVTPDPLMPATLTIQDIAGNAVADIEVSRFGTSESHTVYVEGEKPFVVRRKQVMGTAYEVQGLDYEVHGNQNGTENELCSLTGERIAVIIGQEKGGFGRSLQNMDVRVQPQYENNIYIMLISICVLIQNEEVQTRHLDHNLQM